MPTPQEEIYGLLTGVPLQFHVHLMDRGPNRDALASEVRTAEEEADRLAYELLAPGDVVLERAGDRRGDRGVVAELLEEDFGLPKVQARQYAERLLPVSVQDPLLRRLGLD